MNQDSLSNSRVVFWAGVALALGSFGVVLASIFYALSPIAAALPMPAVSIESAYQGMLPGRNSMLAAGLIGLFSDVTFIAGSLLLTVFRAPASHALQRVGWALVTIGVTIFIMVDALAAGVLTQLALLDGALSAFAAFKLLFNIFFIFGTITVGLGVPVILACELRTPSSILFRPLAWIGILFALSGLIASMLYFFNVALPLLIGISICGTSLIFGIYGIQIARQPNS